MPVRMLPAVTREWPAHLAPIEKGDCFSDAADEEPGKLRHDRWWRKWKPKPWQERRAIYLARKRNSA